MTITDADLGQLQETQAWAAQRDTQAISITFAIEAETRERAIAQFMQFFGGVADLADETYGIVAAAVELVPEPKPCPMCGAPLDECLCIPDDKLPTAPEPTARDLELDAAWKAFHDEAQDMSIEELYERIGGQ